MSKTTMTGRRFEQDASAARKAAAGGPVLITERGRPAHVIMSYAEYRRLSKVDPSVADLLFDPDGLDIDFDPPKLDLKLKIPDFR